MSPNLHLSNYEGSDFLWDQTVRSVFSFLNLLADDAKQELQNKWTCQEDFHDYSWGKIIPGSGSVDGAQVWCAQHCLVQNLGLPTSCQCP